MLGFGLYLESLALHEAGKFINCHNRILNEDDEVKPPNIKVIVFSLFKKFQF
jgi:hypothetical protein